MKFSIIIIFSILLLSGCSKEDHHYSLKNGYAYGYESAVSYTDRRAGVANNALIMAKYAGQKNGQYQFFYEDGTRVTVVQCSKPCEFMKTMTFYNKELDATRFYPADGSLWQVILEDAMNGKLEQWHADKDGHRETIWFTEAGPQITTK